MESNLILNLLWNKERQKNKNWTSEKSEDQKTEMTSMLLYKSNNINIINGLNFLLNTRIIVKVTESPPKLIKKDQLEILNGH